VSDILGNLRAIRLLVMLMRGMALGLPRMVSDWLRLTSFFTDL